MPSKEKMDKISLVMMIFFLGLFAGYGWAFYHYQVLN
jgi:hypothetical protein